MAKEEKITWKKIIQSKGEEKTIKAKKASNEGLSLLKKYLFFGPH